MRDTKLVDGVRFYLTDEEQAQHNTDIRAWDARSVLSEEERIYKEEPLVRFILKELAVHTSATEEGMILRYRRELLAREETIRVPFYLETIPDEQFFYFYIPEPERTITETPRVR